MNDDFDLSSGTFNGGTGDINIGDDCTFSGGTFTNTTGTLIMDSYNQSDGTFNGGTGDIDMNDDFTLSGGTFTSTSGTLYVDDDWIHNAGGTFNHNNGTVEFVSGDDANFNVNVSETFNNVNFNKDNTDHVTIQSGTMIITGTLNLMNGIVNNGTMEAQGDVNVENAFDGGSASLEFTGTSDQTFDLSGGGENNFDGNITINKTSGTVTLASDFDLDENNRDLTIVEGTLDIAGNDFAVNGNNSEFIIEDGGIFRLQGGETVTTRPGYPQFDNGSTCDYYGSGTYNSLAAGDDYSNLTISGTGTYNLDANLTVNGNLSIANNSGILDLNSNDLTMGAGSVFGNIGTLKLVGTETLANFTNDTDSGTVEYTGGGVYTGFVAGDNYYSLTFSGAGTHNLNNALDVNGNLVIGNNNTINAGANTVNIGRNFENNGIFTSSGTVIFDGSGDSLISGSTTFNNLSCATAGKHLIFQAGSTQTIQGTMSFSGEAGGYVFLQSSSDGSYWNIDPQGGRNVSWVYVRDSRNINSTIIADNSIDGGNNVNWFVMFPLALEQALQIHDRIFRNQMKRLDHQILETISKKDLSEHLIISNDLDVYHGFDMEFLNEEVRLGNIILFIPLHAQKSWE